MPGAQPLRAAMEETMKVTINGTPSELAALILHLGASGVGPAPEEEPEGPVLGYGEAPPVVRPEDFLKRIPQTPAVAAARAAGRAAVMPPADE